MGILNLTRFPQGGRLTSDWLNRIFGALTGDLYLRDEDGNLSDGTENIGSDGNRVGTIFANNLDLGDGVSLVTRTGQAWWNGILKGSGASLSMSVLPGANYDLAFLAGTIVAAAGKQKTMAGTVTIPAPVGSAPRSALFDIRKFPLCPRAMSGAATFANGRAPVLERTVSGSVKEYARGVFYDVGATADTVTAAAFIGAYAEPAVAPTAEVGDGDRMLSAADNRIYRRVSGVWLATDEALIGAVLFDDSGGQLRGVDFRSREFLEIVRAIPQADYVQFAENSVTKWASTIYSNYFGVGTSLEFPDFTPWFRDPATGALAPLTAAVGEDDFVGMASAVSENKPIALANAGEAVKGIFGSDGNLGGPAPRGIVAYGYPGFPIGNLEDGAVKVSGFYVGDGIAGWGRADDERTLPELLEYPDVIAGMHSYLPARALFYAFRFGTSAVVTFSAAGLSVAAAQATRPFAAGLKTNAPPLPDGSIDVGATGDFEALKKARVNGSASFTGTPSTYSPWVLLRRPDHLLGREGEAEFAPRPATKSSEYGEGVSPPKFRFGIDRAALVS